MMKVKADGHLIVVEKSAGEEIINLLLAIWKT
jgi:hypothetical protein